MTLLQLYALLSTNHGSNCCLNCGSHLPHLTNFVTTPRQVELPAAVACGGRNCHDSWKVTFEELGIYILSLCCLFNRHQILNQVYVNLASTISIWLQEIKV